MSQCNRKLAKQLVDEYNRKHQTDVKVFDANKSFSRYEIDIRDYRVNSDPSYYIKQILFEN